MGVFRKGTVLYSVAISKHFRLRLLGIKPTPHPYVEAKSRNADEPCDNHPRPNHTYQPFHPDVGVVQFEERQWHQTCDEALGRPLPWKFGHLLGAYKDSLSQQRFLKIHHRHNLTRIVCLSRKQKWGIMQNLVNDWSPLYARGIIHAELQYSSSCAKVNYFWRNLPFRIRVFFPGAMMSSEYWTKTWP